MSSRPIRFFHRGAIVEVDGVATTRTVLDWLREDARCTGTKEGCNEGDCGACTVVVGMLPGEAQAGSPEQVGGLHLTTTNACIQFLPTLDGKALFTVEDLKAEALHPVQQALVECDGSQCGFCTPGFVMSLWATYQHHGARGSRPTRQQLADELSGNLCRCTGYRPILDAGERMFDLRRRARWTPRRHGPRSRPMRSDREPFRYAGRLRAGGAAHARRTSPRCAAARPEARLLAGSTDVGLWVNKMFRPLGDIIFVGDVDALKRIATTDGELSIGAGASLEDAWVALVARWPALRDVWLRFASPPIRNAGTMGGNVANGSPIGDSPPILIALDAQIELRKGARVRRMALADFYVDYMKNQMEPGEFVQAVAVPLAVTARQVRAYKISKRFDCDISAVATGLLVELDGDGRRGRALRLRRHGRDGEARGCRRGRHRRPAVERGDARTRDGRARRGLQTLDGHARQRRLPAAGGAEPAAPLLDGDAPRASPPSAASVFSREVSV